MLLLKHIPVFSQKLSFSNYKDRTNLDIALQKMKELANSMNNKKREVDNAIKMHILAGKLKGAPAGFSLIIPGRSIIQEGSLMRIKKDKAKKDKNSSDSVTGSHHCYLFLMTDILLWTYPVIVLCSTYVDINRQKVHTNFLKSYQLRLSSLSKSVLLRLRKVAEN